MNRHRRAAAPPSTPARFTVADLSKGDVAVFKGHKIRVETEPLRRGRRIRLQGRENRDGCPYVTRWYFDNLPLVRIEVSK